MNNAPRIACLGWGSLICEPRELPVVGEWAKDGPQLPVEFARESGGHRITLVICEHVAPVTTLWALMNVADLNAAIAALAHREGIVKRIASDIGYFDAVSGRRHGAKAEDIAAWSQDRNLDGVVWTNLPCGFTNSRGLMPSAEDVVAHLNALEGEERANARKYVEQAPQQVETAYRAKIRSDLGWA